MQQMQEKQQNKIQSNGSEPAVETFKESITPTVLSVASKVCYGLSASTVLLSVGIWNRPSLGKITLWSGSKSQAKKLPGFQKSSKPSQASYAESQRLGTFVSVLAPTFVIAGKVLEDASERVARHEFTQWELKQVEKTRTPEFRTRFFGR